MATLSTMRVSSFLCQLPGSQGLNLPRHQTHADMLNLAMVQLPWRCSAPNYLPESGIRQCSSYVDSPFLQTLQ